MVAPEIKNLRTDMVEAVEHPAKDKLAILVYLYLRVSVSGSNTEGLIGFTDDEKEIVDTYLRDWFDEWKTESDLGPDYGLYVGRLIGEVAEYENSGKGDGDAGYN